MSIAVDALRLVPKLRRSGTFLRRFMESFVSLSPCTVTMNRSSEKRQPYAAFAECCGIRKPDPPFWKPVGARGPCHAPDN
jgi:hypothetical protein